MSQSWPVFWMLTIFQEYSGKIQAKLFVHLLTDVVNCDIIDQKGQYKGSDECDFKIFEFRTRKAGANP